MIRCRLKEISMNNTSEIQRQQALTLGAARVREEATSSTSADVRATGISHANAIDEKMRSRLSFGTTELGAGGELVQHVNHDVLGEQFRSTLKNPDHVAAGASRVRMELAYDAGMLHLALDAADTIGAQNSIEQMLAHQIAVAHGSALKMASQLNRQIECMNVLKDDRRQLASVEACRLVGAISRLMAACQQGALSLQRLKTGGRQLVTVQHVHVGSGGQAIVTGKMRGPGVPPTVNGTGEGMEFER